MKDFSKNKKIKYFLILIAIITIVVTGTYAIYKQTISGKIKSNMATTIIDLQTNEGNKFALKPDTTTVEYTFAVNNYKTVDGSVKTNEVLSDYYIKISGITNSAITSTLYYVNSNNVRQALTLQTTGDYSGYYKAPIQLQISNQTTDNYVLVMSITGTYTQNDTMSVDVDLGYVQYVADDTEEQLVNAPELADGMVPVKWDGTNWIKVSSSNTSKEWYDYANQKWANVALVSESYRTVADETAIPEENIYAMFVWIPRFVYKIPSSYYHTAMTQATFASDTSNSNAVDIQFSKSQADGGDTWNSDIVVTNSSSITNNASDGWMTCPAFTFGDTELNGFWMAKFKASDNSATSTLNTGKDGTITTVYIKPSRYSETNMKTDDTITACRNMETNSIYGWTTSSTLNTNGSFATDTNNLDTHLIKNSEWAAVCFLTNSQYGVNKSAINNSASTATGTITGESATVTTVYNTNIDMSTTGNAYGVYDMSSTVWDSVAAYIDAGNSMGTTILTNLLAKYRDAYTVPSGVNYTVTYTDRTSVYGMFEHINGTAIWETSSNGNTSATAWFNGRSNIGNYSKSKYTLLITRGGSYNGYASIYAFGYGYGTDKNTSKGFRPTIAVY